MFLVWAQETPVARSEPRTIYFFPEARSPKLPQGFCPYTVDTRRFSKFLDTQLMLSCQDWPPPLGRATQRQAGATAICLRWPKAT